MRILSTRQPEQGRTIDTPRGKATLLELRISGYQDASKELIRDCWKATLESKETIEIYILYPDLNWRNERGRK